MATIEPILPADTVPDAAFYNAAANASVRAWCGWHIAPVITETLILDGSGGIVQLLPTQRIVAISSALLNGVDVTDRIRWSRHSGVIQLGTTWDTDDYPYGYPWGGCVFPNLPGVLEITLDHGYDLDEVPDVANVIASVQSRSAAAPAGVVAQAVGSASIRYAETTTSGVAAAPMLGWEMGALAPYRLNQGV